MVRKEPLTGADRNELAVQPIGIEGSNFKLVTPQQLRKRMAGRFGANGYRSVLAFIGATVTDFVAANFTQLQILAIFPRARRCPLPRPTDRSEARRVGRRERARE